MQNPAEPGREQDLQDASLRLPQPPAHPGPLQLEGPETSQRDKGWAS